MEEHPPFKADCSPQREARIPPLLDYVNQITAAIQMAGITNIHQRTCSINLRSSITT